MRFGRCGLRWAGGDIKLREILIEGFRTVIRDHTKVGKEYRWSKDFAYMMALDEAVIAITYEGMDKVQEIVGEVYHLRPYAKELFGEKYVRERVLRSIKKIVKERNGCSYEQEVDSLLDSLKEQRIQWKVVVPVENLQVERELVIYCPARASSILARSTLAS